MAAYLIDYENVHQNGLAGISKLTDADTVIIFVGNQINDVPFDTVYSILNSPAEIKMKKMKKTAKDYLDFQLATCLGGLVESGQDKEFYVISGDSGFEAVIDYWKANKPSVSIEQRVTIMPESLAAAIPVKPKQKAAAKQPASPNLKLDNATKKKIRDIVKSENMNPGQYTGIYNLFLNANDKSALHTGLVRLFEQEQGRRLYGVLKDIFDHYKA